MNVQVEALPNCLATLRVDLPPDAVNAARAENHPQLRRERKAAWLPPREGAAVVIERKFQKEIREELQRKLLSESTRAAISEKHLRVLQVQNVEDVEFAPDQSLRFTATVVTMPDFDLPEYRKIPVTVPREEVSDAEVDDAIENLRSQAATFEDITGRGLEMEDYAVIDYSGSIDGKPVSEVFPKVRQAADQQRRVLGADEAGAILPGFCEALLGAVLGETREFDLTVPADFAVQEMARKKIHYSVTVNGLKSKKLPELDDTFASTIVEGKKLEDVRALAKRELARQKKGAIESPKREQMMGFLVTKVECELPQNYVAGETRRILADIVQREQSRGMPDEAIKGSEKELVEMAARGAKAEAERDVHPPAHRRGGKSQRHPGGNASPHRRHGPPLRHDPGQNGEANSKSATPWTASPRRSCRAR